VPPRALRARPTRRHAAQLCPASPATVRAPLPPVPHPVAVAPLPSPPTAAMNQDWEPVKIRPKTGSRKADVNAAVRAGGAVVTEKKRTLGRVWWETDLGVSGGGRPCGCSVGLACSRARGGGAVVWHATFEGVAMPGGVLCWLALMVAGAFYCISGCVDAIRGGSLGASTEAWCEQLSVLTHVLLSPVGRLCVLIFASH